MAKSLSAWDKLQSHLPENGNLARLCYKMESSSGRKTYLSLNFNGHQACLEKDDCDILGKALKKTDQVEALHLTHQVNVTDLTEISNYVKSSRALKILDVSYSNVEDLRPLINAINPVENTNAFESLKGDAVGEVTLLDFSGITIDKQTIDDLSEKLQHNKSVEALRLKSCDLTIDSIIQLLDGVSKNVTLQALDISRGSRVNNPYNLSVHLQNYFANNSHTISTLVLNHLNLDDQSIRNIVLGLLRSENNLKALNVASNKFSRDAAQSIVKLLTQNQTIDYLNLSYNRLENAGVCAILECLEHKNSGLKTLIIKSCEASEPSWVTAERVFSKNSGLKEFYLWGNDFSGQVGALALKRLVDKERFATCEGIDLQNYTVDGRIQMAEDGDAAIAAEHRFHWTLDKH